MDKQKVKIKDIASRVGVSPATVSLALNQRAGVSKETIDRVLQEAEAMGYKAKQPSRKSSSQPLRTLGMVIKSQPGDPLQDNPFYSKVIFGIEDACARLKFNLFFATLPVDEKNLVQGAPQVLYSDSVDGLLMVGAFIDETVTSVMNNNHPPIVLVDAYSNTESFDMVISDNFGASYQAVEYLIKKGHRHIGMIGGEIDAYPSLKDRRRGYLQALKDYGIQDVYFASFNVQTFPSVAFVETTRLLKDCPQITALFGINDMVAVGAIQAAQALGKRVPEDVSVIGYDDTFMAASSTPKLTTMHVDTDAMGRAAVQLLTFRLDNPEIARMTLTIHPHLVERESVSEFKW